MEEGDGEGAQEDEPDAAGQDDARACKNILADGMPLICHDQHILQPEQYRAREDGGSDNASGKPELPRKADPAMQAQAELPCQGSIVECELLYHPSAGYIPRCILQICY